MKSSGLVNLTTAIASVTFLFGGSAVTAATSNQISELPSGTIDFNTSHDPFTFISFSVVLLEAQGERHMYGTGKTHSPIHQEMC